MTAPPMPAAGPVRRPPKLRARGRRFWDVTRAEYVLSRAELEVLAEVCRLLDLCDTLRKAIDDEGATTVGSQGQPVAHPALAHLSAARQLLGRLLAQLDLPDEAGEKLPTPEQTRAAAAAAERWRGHTPSNVRRMPRGSA